ncbi:MAG: cytochrome c, partial [Sphingobacteriales bacterium]
ILKWTGISVLVLLCILTIIVASRQNLKYDASYPIIKASTDSSVIARGKHLIYGPAHCITCHGPANSDSLLKAGKTIPLIGGVAFKLPVGVIYSKNITPDAETGIGKFTDPEIGRALRYGVHPDGTVVFDFMPFHNLSNNDLTAVISYLRAQKPVKNKIPENTLNIMGKLVKAFMVKPVGPTETIQDSVKIDSSATYGKYIALNVANCNGCHTLRDMSGAYIGEPFAGGGAFKEPGKTTLYPPNLTPDSSSRIFGWSQQMFVDRFRMGKIIYYSHMPWNCFNTMSDDELKAIYKYLKTLKPAKTTVQKKES